LPEQVEFARNGITLKGYPALVVEEGGKLALRLLDCPQRAQTALRLGLRRLLALRLRDQMKYLKQNLLGLQTMSLQYVGGGTQEDLREDLLAAILDRAFLEVGPLPRNQAEFETCLERGKARLLLIANEVCDLTGQTLAAFHAVRKILNGDIPLGWMEAVADSREQVDRLIYPGFVSRTPTEWLRQLPRYLKAIEVRLQKLKQAPERDRQRRVEIAGLWEECKVLLQRHANRGESDPELEKFRWMLEELRVSLFAQELKTAVPVSVKKAEEQLKKVRSGIQDPIKPLQILRGRNPGFAN
jgi:ATP-dependent helicase HrpA